MGVVGLITCDMKKNMTKLAAIAALLTVCIPKANAQVQRSEWTAGPIITTTNPIYSGAAMVAEGTIAAIYCGVDMEDGTAKRDLPSSAKFWMPMFTYKWHAIKSMKIDDEKAKFRHKMDWSLKNYSVGYRLGYMSRTAPLGFEIQANYEQVNMAYKMPEDEDYRDATKTMFVPTALLKVRFGSYTTGAFCPTLEIGGSYDYALSYKEKSEGETIKNKDLVNSGFSGIVGIGFTIPSTHWHWNLRYSHQFYKYYNKDAELDGQKLNFNEKSTFGTFMLVSSYAF